VLKSRILLVDDVKENIQILKAILKQNNYIVDSTNNGYEALRLVKKYEYDLILLDIMMPDISGIEVCRYLKVDLETKSIPVIFLTASGDREILTKAFNVGGVDYIKKPYFKDELLARVKSAINMRTYEKELEEKVRERTQQLEDSQVHLMKMLGGIAEGHSIETHQHVIRVAEITYLLAIKYGLDEEEAKKLKFASYLHDIGKLGVKDYILHKDGKLTPKEFEEIKKHPKLGSSMLKGVKLPLFEAAQIVSEQHHEKWDGSGYPKGLKAKEIHPYGRIVAIADVFDALSSKRSYKKGWNMVETLSFFQEMKGVHFDPAMVDLLMKHIDEFLAIYNTSMEKVSKQKVIQEPKKKKRSKIMEWLLQEL
jgi:putative two-component system response regulator